MQPWFNQTGFYGCQTRLTTLYIWVNSLVNQAISGELSKRGIIPKKKKRTVALSRRLKFRIYRVNQASNTFCSPGWLLCTMAHCEKAIMVDYSGDEIWEKCQGLIVYLFSPQISPTKGKKQLPFLVKLLFFSVYSTAVQYFPCLKKHSKTCWKKKKWKKHFVKASFSCLSGAVLSHFWYVYQHN